MMRTPAVVLGCLLMLVALPGASHGQTADPQFRADIERLLEATGATSVGTQMATLATEQMIGAMKAAQPNVPERVMTIVKDVMSAEFARAFEGPGELKRALVDVYAKHYTHDEVRLLLNFYSTDVGRKTARLMPTVAREGAAAGEAWAQANMPRIMADMQARLKAEGLLK